MNFCTNNPSLYANALTFEKTPHELISGSMHTHTDKYLDTGALMQPNGDVLFRFYAPTVRSITLAVKMLAGKEFQAKNNYDRTILTERGHKDEDYSMELEKKENGCFEGLLKWSEKSAGFCGIQVFVDGLLVVEPHLPVYFSGNHAANYVEIPDPSMPEILVEKDVPHGAVTIDVYWSEVMQRMVRQFVYTPPCYRSGTEKYPVVYLHQGYSETETGWVFQGKVPQIMDNLIAAGKCEPAIIVMSNGMYRKPEDEEWKYDGFIEMVCKDVIPYVEANYRCIADKWHRSLAGLSMGGMQAAQGGLGHPELFAYLGLFCCSIRPRDTQLDFDKNEYLEILKDPQEMEKQYKLFYRAAGLGETMRDRVVLEDEDWVISHGVDKLKCYQRRFFMDNGGEHDWSTFRRCFADYITQVFKD